jgi:hypothetical protein
MMLDLSSRSSCLLLMLGLHVHTLNYYSVLLRQSLQDFALSCPCLFR